MLSGLEFRNFSFCVSMFTGLSSFPKVPYFYLFKITSPDRLREPNYGGEDITNNNNNCNSEASPSGRFMAQPCAGASPLLSIPRY